MRELYRFVVCLFVLSTWALGIMAAGLFIHPAAAAIILGGTLVAIIDYPTSK